jgi:hypothetical protein
MRASNYSGGGESSILTAPQAEAASGVAGSNVIG